MEDFFYELSKRAIVLLNNSRDDDVIDVLDYLHGNEIALEDYVFRAFEDNSDELLYEILSESKNEGCSALRNVLEAVMSGLYAEGDRLLSASMNDLERHLKLAIERAVEVFNKQIYIIDREGNDEWGGNNNSWGNKSKRRRSNNGGGNRTRVILNNSGGGNKRRRGSNNRDRDRDGGGSVWNRHGSNRNNNNSREFERENIEPSIGGGRMAERNDIIPRRENRNKKPTIKMKPLASELLSDEVINQEPEIKPKAEIVAEKETWLNESTMQLVSIDPNSDSDAEYNETGSLSEIIVKSMVSSSANDPKSLFIVNSLQSSIIVDKTSPRTLIDLASSETLADLASLAKRAIPIESPLFCYINNFVNDLLRANIGFTGLTDVIAKDLVYIEDIDGIQEEVGIHSKICNNRFESMEKMILARLFSDVTTKAEIKSFSGKYLEMVKEGEAKGYIPMPIKTRYIIVSYTSLDIPVGPIEKLRTPLFYALAKKVFSDRSKCVIVTSDMEKLVITKRPRSSTEEDEFDCINYKKQCTTK